MLHFFGILTTRPLYQSLGIVSLFQMFWKRSVITHVDVRMSAFSISAWMASMPHSLPLFRVWMAVLISADSGGLMSMDLLCCFYVHGFDGVTFLVYGGFFFHFRRRLYCTEAVSKFQYKLLVFLWMLTFCNVQFLLPVALWNWLLQLEFDGSRN